MSWTYSQKTGQLMNPAGGYVGLGYSGRNEGLNNPDLQETPMTGPIPQGEWAIGEFFHDPEKGPVVAHLAPASGTDTFGRSGFMVHGDNSAGDHSASEGCIILARDLREMLRDSSDQTLVVTA